MTRVQRPFRPIWCLKHSSGIGLLACARRLLDTSAVPMSKSCATFKKVACCAANQCLKGAASSCIGEEATLNCNFTYKLLYIDAGNRQNYTRRCAPPFFCKGVAPNGVTNGPIVIGLFCAQLRAVTYTPYQACNRRSERIASLFGK